MHLFLEKGAPAPRPLQAVIFVGHDELELLETATADYAAQSIRYPGWQNPTRLEMVLPQPLLLAKYAVMNASARLYDPDTVVADKISKAAAASVKLVSKTAKETEEEMTPQLYLGTRQGRIALHCISSYALFTIDQPEEHTELATRLAEETERAKAR